MSPDVFAILSSVDADEGAEKALIGAIMADPMLLDDLPPGLSSVDFFHPQHVSLFEYMRSEHAAGRAVDAHLSASHLASKFFEDAATRDQLQELADSSPDAQFALAHAERVVKLAEQRRVVSQLQSALQAARSGDIDSALKKSAETARNNFGSSAAQASKLQAKPDDLRAKLRERKELADAGVATVFATGVAEIDRALGGGFVLGQLIAVAGRPGSGKTALLNQIERNTSRAGGHVLSLGYEMSADQTRARHLAAMTGVETRKILTGRMSDAELELVESAIASPELSNIYFSDRRGSVADIRRTILSHIRAHGVPTMIGVDYLQKAVSKLERGQSAIDAVGELSDALADIARTHCVTIVAASQVNREFLKTGRKISASDLAGGDAIERDAGHILLVHKPTKQDPSKPLMRTIESDKCRNDLAVCVQLELHGPTSTFRTPVGPVEAGSEEEEVPIYLK